MAGTCASPLVSASPHSPPEILFATDFSEVSRRALVCAKQIARLRAAPLHTLHVVDLTNAAGGAPSTFSVARDLAHRGLRHIQHELRLAGIAGSSTLIGGGSPAYAIQSAVVRYHPSLLVLGLESEHTMLAPALGPTIKSILRSAACPVLVIGPHPPGHPGARQPEALERAVFVTDTAPSSLEAALRAWPFIGNAPAPRLFAVLPPDSAPDFGFSADARQRFDCPRTLPFPGAAEELRAEIAGFHAGLVVFGIRSGGYLDSLSLAGLLSCTIIRSPCPVLVVRA